MKTRPGFVSNSSSSSFVVAFPHIPKGVSGVHELLFKTDRTGVVDYYEYETSTTKVAAQVWDDIYKQLENFPRTTDYLRTEINGYSGDGSWARERIAEEAGVPFDELAKLEGTARILADKFIAQHVDPEDDKVLLEFIDEHPDAAVFVFTYADDDGEFFSIMEHGEIFHLLPHYQFGHH